MIFWTKKAKVDDSDEHLHLRIHKPLPMAEDPSPKLANVQTGKKHDDSLDYF